MSKSYSDSYRDAGVDVTAGYESVELFKDKVKSTFIPGVLGGIGGFGGLFELNLKDMKRPVTVSGTDGVGTKIKLAMELDIHDTIGIDAVAMCVNDIVCSGAAPMFFLDYIACGKNYPEKIAKIVSGVADGCKMAGCALIGGETAEHPGLMPENDYDLAGFAVGVVDYDDIIDGSKLAEGDVILGLRSSGVHSNGFSLVRKVIGDTRDKLEEYVPELGKTIGEALLTPTIIYVKQVLDLIKKVDVKAISHITGGGFYENIPRMLRGGFMAEIDRASIQIPELFNIIAKRGNIPERDMFNTFNMGVGMAIAVAESDAQKALDILGDSAYAIGRVKAGEGIEIK